MTYQRKSLTGCAAEHAIDGLVFDTGQLSNFHTTQADDGNWNDCCCRKIEFVYGAMDRINLNCGGNIETGLLEAEAKAACACE